MLLFERCVPYDDLAIRRLVYNEVAYPAQRGKYRCDTFVARVLSASALYGTFNSDAIRWGSQVSAFDTATLTPRQVFNALAVFH